MKKIWRAAFFLLLVAVVYLSWKPAPQISELKVLGASGRWFDAHDHSKNFIGFAALGFAGFLAFAGVRAVDILNRERRLVWRQGRLLLWLVGVICFLEVGQLFIPRRSADLADVLFGSLGALAAWAVAQVINRTGWFESHSDAGEKPVRVVVWGINYAPELTGIAPCNTSWCEELVKRGAEVTMVTGFPYYPQWRKRPEDANRWWATETVRGVKVCRCWLYVPQKVTTLKRIMHEASFVLTSFFRVLFLPEADLLFVVSPPLLLGPASWAAAALRHWSQVFHVQDLQPEAAAGLGLLQNKSLIRVLMWMERFSYEHAGFVSGIHPGMLAAFAERGIPAEKCLLFPNGVRLEAALPVNQTNTFRQRHNIPAEDFLLVYSGNLGVKQGLDQILEALALLKQEPLRLLICGDGMRRVTLEALARELQLKRVQFLPLQPEEAYQEMVLAADACLVSQVSGVGRCFFPSKVQSIMTLGGAILSVADGDSELVRVVREAGCGMNIEPGAPAELAAGLKEFAARREQLPVWRTAARTYAARYRWPLIVDNVLQEMKNRNWGQDSRWQVWCRQIKPVGD